MAAADRHHLVTTSEEDLAECRLCRRAALLAPPRRTGPRQALLKKRLDGFEQRRPLAVGQPAQRPTDVLLQRHAAGADDRLLRGVAREALQDRAELAGA